MTKKKEIPGLVVKKEPTGLVVTTIATIPETHPVATETKQQEQAETTTQTIEVATQTLIASNVEKLVVPELIIPLIILTEKKSDIPNHIEVHRQKHIEAPIVVISVHQELLTLLTQDLQEIILPADHIHQEVDHQVDHQEAAHHILEEDVNNNIYFFNNAREGVC